MRCLRPPVVAAFLLLLASPALAKPEQPAQRGDGGLHVCCGGMIGSVGGSGSISGTVRGPGAGPSAPRPVVREDVPPALTKGIVEPAEIAVRDDEPVEAEEASSTATGPLLAALLVAVAAIAIFARRRSAPV